MNELGSLFVRLTFPWPLVTLAKSLASFQSVCLHQHQDSLKPSSAGASVRHNMRDCVWIKGRPRPPRKGQLGWLMKHVHMSRAIKNLVFFQLIPRGAGGSHKIAVCETENLSPAPFCSYPSSPSCAVLALPSVQVTLFSPFVNGGSLIHPNQNQEPHTELVEDTAYVSFRERNAHSSSTL